MKLGNGLTVQLGMHSLLHEGCRQAVAAAYAFSSAVGLKDGHIWHLASVSTGFGKSKMKRGASCLQRLCFHFVQ